MIIRLYISKKIIKITETCYYWAVVLLKYKNYKQTELS